MRFVAAVMAGVVLSAASAASAFTPGGAFTATGSLTILKGPFALQCNASAQIVGVPGAGGTVVSVTFSGTPACSATGPTGLPWPITPTSTTAATLSSVGIGGCGAGTLNAGWSNTPPGSFSLSPQPLGGCTVSGSLSVSPPQTLP